MTTASSVAVADNPIVQTSYTADPAPMVYDGRLYLYTSHDEDVTVNNFFTMNDWRLYSTVDMVNWTDHGSPAGYKTYSWGTGRRLGGARRPEERQVLSLHADQQLDRLEDRRGWSSNSPDRPVHGPARKGADLDRKRQHRPDGVHRRRRTGLPVLGESGPLVREAEHGHDLLSGQPDEGEPDHRWLRNAFQHRSGDGVRRGAVVLQARLALLHRLSRRRDAREDQLHDQQRAARSLDVPGDIMAKESGTGASFTNHPGVVDYKGHSYFFYHNGALPGGGGYKRSVCVEEFTYGADGSIPTITMTTTGPTAVATLNPFRASRGRDHRLLVRAQDRDVHRRAGMDVTQISNGDYIKVQNVDFGTGATSFDARVASAASGGSIELHLDSQTGTLLGTCAVSGTGGAQTWMTKSCTVSGATGIHDLFLKFTGGSGATLFNFNWWKFTPKDAPDGGAPDGGGGGGGSGGSSGTAGTSGRGGTGGGTGGVHRSRRRRARRRRYRHGRHGRSDVWRRREHRRHSRHVGRGRVGRRHGRHVERWWRSGGDGGNERHRGNRRRSGRGATAARTRGPPVRGRPAPRRRRRGGRRFGRRSGRLQLPDQLQRQRCPRDRVLAAARHRPAPAAGSNEYVNSFNKWCPFPTDGRARSPMGKITAPYGVALMTALALAACMGNIGPAPKGAPGGASPAGTGGTPTRGTGGSAPSGVAGSSVTGTAGVSGTAATGPAVPGARRSCSIAARRRRAGHRCAASPPTSTTTRFATCSATRRIRAARCRRRSTASRTCSATTPTSSRRRRC